MSIFPNPRSAMSFSFCAYDLMLLTICTIFDQDHFNVAVDNSAVLIIIIATSNAHSGCRCHVHQFRVKLRVLAFTHRGLVLRNIHGPAKFILKKICNYNIVKPFSVKSISLKTFPSTSTESKGLGPQGRAPWLKTLLIYPLISYGLVRV